MKIQKSANAIAKRRAEEIAARIKLKNPHTDHGELISKIYWQAYCDGYNACLREDGKESLDEST